MPLPVPAIAAFAAVAAAIAAATALCREEDMGPWKAPAAAIAALTAALLTVAAPWHGPNGGASRLAQLAAMVVLVGGLSALSCIDLDRYLLPVRIVYPTMAIITGALAVAAVTGAGWGPLLRAAFASLVAGALYLIVHLLRPEGMGFGDVRLAVLVGLPLGWVSWPTLVSGLLLGLTAGALAGAFGMLTGRLGRSDPLPFGPFLSAGAVAALCLTRWL